MSFELVWPSYRGIGKCPTQDHGQRPWIDLTVRKQLMWHIPISQWWLHCRQGLRCSGPLLCDYVCRWGRELSVRNASGPSLRVRVRVGTEPDPDWRSGSSINLNCRFWYGSIDISLPVWIGWVFSGLYSGFSCTLINMLAFAIRL
jgi:hypothetical protein